MKKTVAVVILAVAAIALLTFFFFYGGSGGNGSSFAHTGTVEAVEVTVSFQIPGKVASVTFEEGETIREGQILASLDTLSLIQELTRARAAHAAAVSKLATSRARAEYLRKSVNARIKGAEANLQKLLSGLRPQEVEAAKQAVERTRAEAERAEKEANRIKRLYEDGVVPLARWEDARAAAQVAKAALISAGESLEMAELGSRREDVQGARAAFQEARAQLEEVQAAELEAQSLESEVKLREADANLASIRLSHATLEAPVSGIALTRIVEPGENILAAGPVTTIADLSEVKVRFYVPEGDLGSLRLGQTVHIISDSFPDRQLEGRISYISEQAEFTPKNILTKEERTKLVFMVKVLAPNPDTVLKPGMPVEVVLEP